MLDLDKLLDGLSKSQIDLFQAFLQETVENQQYTLIHEANGRVLQRIEKMSDGIQVPIALSRHSCDATLESIILSEETRSEVRRFAEEYNSRDKLSEFGIKPRNTLLFIGPPGNGKTQITKALANLLDLPLYFVRYEALASENETENLDKIGEIFNYVSERNCILFFDEIDAIGQSREGRSDTKVVTTLLTLFDKVPPNVIIAAATNFHGDLDSALRRRLKVRIRLPAPNYDNYTQYLKEALPRYGISIPETVNLRMVAIMLQVENYADAEEFVLSVSRAKYMSDGKYTDEFYLNKALEAWPKTRASMA
ncbi:AAA family ATPase [Flexibacterium corallicola]|uniref:AAA family ATPase n=1 Tax=Flexibacterium corallicola TaxID=3037259 RepID=UPI00286ED243|nr:ATP-binding protein [Pseudovibrio sp. M1P-2-3]